MSEREEAEAAAEAFFSNQHGAFLDTLARGNGHPRLPDVLAEQAHDSFERNVELQSEACSSPAAACAKGCPTCCSLRVTATAPEVLLLARYIKTTASRLEQAGLDIVRRVADAHARGGDLGEGARMRAQISCPLLVRGACLFHKARPLSCRGHTSFSREACIDAVAGREEVAVPVSSTYAGMRSLVQSALQSALKSAGLAWAAYELNGALDLALSDPACAERWLKGEDVFARVRVDAEPLRVAQSLALAPA